MGLNYGNSHTSQDITLTNGDYIYNVTCEDRAGNEKEKEVNLTVNTNLLIQATTNFNGQSINDNQPQIIVTTDRESVCTAGGSGYHTLNEGGTEVTQFISTDTITHNAYLSSQASTPAPLADDTYTVEITCQSLAPGIGEGTTTATFTIDTNVNPPVITNFVDNPTIPIVTEYPDVSFTVDEEVTATILVNDKPKETQTNLLPGTIHTFENVQLANKGVNIVTIGIIDEAGNENFASILINLSTDNPVIDETKSRHPDHNRIYGGLNESYTYFNSDLDITSAEITLEGDEGTTYNDGTITIDNLNRKIIYNETGTLASDNYTLQINITDTSGRKSENSIIRFEIDLESPVISVTSPGVDEVVTSQIVTVTSTTDK